MDSLGFLGLAYIVVWIGLAGYLFSVARRQKALERRLESLVQAEKKESNE
ncbi:MAG: CcmD family protein [Actinomycetota bacterium]